MSYRVDRKTEEQKKLSKNAKNNTVDVVATMNNKHTL